MSAICLMSRDSRATCGASTSQGTPWSCLHQEPLADVLAWDSYSYGGPLPSDQAATMDAVAGELMLFGSLPSYGRPLSTRLGVGEAELPVDPATVGRFLAKCAPVDDQGHRWWLGAIDGGADHSGGYGRFQARLGPDPRHHYGTSLRMDTRTRPDPSRYLSQGIAVHRVHVAGNEAG